MSKGRGRGPMSSQSGGERLQKVLARTGLASRRAVEEMIREGRITVNGQVAVLGQRVDLTVDAVKVDGRRVAAGSGKRRYLLLNKPSGYISTSSDPEGRPTVLELLPPNMRKGVFPVGRLDFDTEGLLILTDDGDFAQRVAHPRFGCRKVYEVKVKGRPGGREIGRLRDGIRLGGRRAKPISISSKSDNLGARDSVSNSWWRVILGEGRTRQIREMFFRIGHPVNRLRRVAIGPISDPHLSRGGWRELTEQEVERLREQSPSQQSKSKPRRPRRPDPPTGSADRSHGHVKSNVKGKGGRGKPGRGRRRG